MAGMTEDLKAAAGFLALSTLLEDAPNVKAGLRGYPRPSLVSRPASGELPLAPRHDFGAAKLHARGRISAHQVGFRRTYSGSAGSKVMRVAHGEGCSVR